MNLDDFEPLYLEHAASRAYETRLNAYQNCNVRSHKKRTARIMKKLIDWRRVETLFVDVRFDSKKRSEAFWSYVHAIEDASKEAGNEFCMLKDDSDNHDQYAIIQDGSLRSSHNLQYFIDWGMRNPQKTFYTLTDEQTAEFHRLYRMSRKWSRRLEKVRSYLYLAMEVRLRSWFESSKHDSPYAALRDVRLEEVAKFKVTVDDRCYNGVITSYGSVKWAQWELPEVDFT